MKEGDRKGERERGIGRERGRERERGSPETGPSQDVDETGAGRAPSSEAGPS